MLRTITIALLSIGVLGTTYWGYKEHQEKNTLLIHAENNYQRSFHELSHHMDLLHDSIGTSLAMNSGEKLSPQFVEIWRITSDALANVSQLPLSLIPVHKTEEFLSEIGDFTYRTAIRNLDDEPLNEEEIETLYHFYDQAANLKDELRQMQYDVLQNNLRWMDVELALVTQDDSLDSPIIDGFEAVEKYVDQVSSETAEISYLQTPKPKEGYKALTGKKKNEKEIRQFSKELFNLKDGVEISVSKSGDGADIPFYSVFYEDGKRVYMDITEKGAHPMNILVERDIKKAKLSLNDGLLKAEQYLKEFGYEQLDLLESQQFDNVGVYTFLNKEGEVRIYPDTVVMKVALDNGDIIGLNANDYLYNYQERKIPEPKISVEEARKAVNQSVKVHDENLALIENDLHEEVLAYEFLGEMKDETYRIFINANTGQEEKVEKLTNTEMNFDLAR